MLDFIFFSIFFFFFNFEFQQEVFCVVCHLGTDRKKFEWKRIRSLEEVAMWKLYFRESCKTTKWLKNDIGQ